MSCFSGLQAQIRTLFTVPHQILLLQHEVFSEYAKVAVGQDFVHPWPSIIVLIALAIMSWKNLPPMGDYSLELKLLHKFWQIPIIWCCAMTTFWLWLVFQQIVYCVTWNYWTNESDFRDMPFPWWHSVWSSYLHAPLRSPILSYSFISWLICLLTSIGILVFATSSKVISHYASNAAHLVLQTSTKVLNMAIVFIKSYLMGEENEVTYETFLQRLDKRESSDTFEGIPEEGSGDAIPDRNSIYESDLDWSPKRKQSAYKDAFSEFSASYVTYIDDLARPQQPKRALRLPRNQRIPNSITPIKN